MPAAGPPNIPQVAEMLPPFDRARHSHNSRNTIRLRASPPVNIQHSFPKPSGKLRPSAPAFTLKPITIIPEIPSALGARAPVKTRHSFPKPFGKLRTFGSRSSDTDSHNSRNTLRVGCDGAGENAAILPETPRQAQAFGSHFHSETDSHNSRNTLRPGCEGAGENTTFLPETLRQAQAFGSRSSETDSHNSRNTLRLGCEGAGENTTFLPETLRQAQAFGSRFHS